MFAALRNFGPYVLLGELGAGGMGVVYQARHRELNRTVALKILREDRGADAEVVRRFRVEAEAAASLEHEHIVSVYEVGEHDGQMFLAMKLVDGGTLADRIATGALPPRRAAELLSAVAGAVDHAHQRGVLHRDIKPANILLDEHNAPFLTDFGLAKLRDAPHAITLSHTTLGTPAYMAPEVAANGAHAATTASDLYSLGAVLYQALTGHPPFPGESPLQVLELVKTQTPLPPRALNATIPRELEAICLKCLRQDPRERYASAAELAQDLDRFLRGEPIMAREPTLAELLRAWVRRHRVVAGFAAALLLSLLVGLGATFWQWRRAEHFLNNTRAANERLTDSLAIRDQREAESMLAAGQPQEALQQLARLVKEHPTNSLPATRLFAALTQRSWLWPLVPPLVHGGAVQQGAFTPDSRWILTAAADGWLCVWDASSGERLLKLPHDSARGRFALSPDGRQVATLATNGAARIWQFPGGQLLRPALRLHSSVIALAFSADSQRLATADEEGVGCIWRVSDGQLQTALNHGEVFRGLLFHPRDESLWTLGRTCKLWWFASQSRGRGEAEPPIAPTATFALADPLVHAELSSNGDRLLTVAGNLIQIWDARTGRGLKELSFNGQVNFASFSPDGLWIGSGNDKNRARIQNAQSGEARVTSFTHPSPVNTARFDPAGHWLATASQDGKARVWTAARNFLYAETLGHRSDVRDALFSPDARRLLTLSADGTARLWTAPQPVADVIPIPVPDGEVIYELSPDGEWVAAAGSDNVLRIHPTSPSQTVAITVPLANAANALAFSPDSRWLASGDAKGQVTLTGVTTERGKSVSRQHDEPIAKLLWSSDAQTLAVVTPAHITLWHSSSVGTSAPVVLPVAAAQALDFSPDGKRLAVAGGSLQTSVFDCGTGQLMFQSPPHPGPVVCVRYSPDGCHIACASDGNAVSVCDAGTARFVYPLLRPGADVTAVAFSPDSGTLLTASRNGAVRLWGVADGRLRQDLLRHRSAVLSAEFSQDGAWVVTSSEDRFVRFTHVASGLPGAETSDPVARPRVRFSRDGHRLLVVPEGELPRLLAVPAVALPNAAVLLALTELVLGQQLNAQGGWEDLSTDGYRTRLRIMRETYHSPAPPPMSRFIRSHQLDR